MIHSCYKCISIVICQQDSTVTCKLYMTNSLTLAVARCPRLTIVICFESFSRSLIQHEFSKMLKKSSSYGSRTLDRSTPSLAYIPLGYYSYGEFEYLPYLMRVKHQFEQNL